MRHPSVAGRHGPTPTASGRWILLLALLVGTMLLDTIGSKTDVALAVIGGIYAAIMIGAVVSSEPQRTVRAAGIGAILLLVGYARFANFTVGPSSEVPGTVLSGVLATGCMVLVFRALASKDLPQIDAMAAAVFGYLQIALIFSLLYFQIETVSPNSFEFAHGGSSPTAFLYFSLLTITTLGYGDIVPLSNIARIVAGLEAVTGVMYVALLIGRIVGRR